MTPSTIPNLDDLEIRRPPRPPSRTPTERVELTFSMASFWLGARTARLQFADTTDAHPRDAADHRRAADEYLAIADALTEGKDIGSLPEYVAWRARCTVMVGEGQL